MAKRELPKIYFSERFGVSRKAISDYGAVNINLMNDTPLFIDPMLLFANPKYKKLNDAVIGYLVFLKNKSQSGTVSNETIDAYYTKKEVHQNWLGFSFSGNKGKGFGFERGQKLHLAFSRYFKNIGEETDGDKGHFEKIRFYDKGTGADTISDFIARIMLNWLADYTAKFAAAQKIEQVMSFQIQSIDADGKPRVTQYTLPYIMDDTRKIPVPDFVLLTPKDILSRNIMHISPENLRTKFEDLPDIIGQYFPDVEANHILRERLNEFIADKLKTKKSLSEVDKDEFLERYPDLIEVFIQIQEIDTESAFANNADSIETTETIYSDIVSKFFQEMSKYKSFLRKKSDSFKTALDKALIFKAIAESNSAWVHHRGLLSEADLHRVFKYCVSECDFKIATIVKGAEKLLLEISLIDSDKSMIEIRTAENIQSKSDIKLYDSNNYTIGGIVAIVYNMDAQYDNIIRILNTCALKKNEYDKVVLIDARREKKAISIPAIYRQDGVTAKSIFLSYCHANKKIANQTYDRLSGILECDGTTVTIDEKAVGYKTNLKEFMNTIKQHDFVVSIISDAYVRSQACMYEVVQLISDKNYLKRLLPLLGRNSHGRPPDIFGYKNRIAITGFWRKKATELRRAIAKESDAEAKKHMQNDLDEITIIISKVANFLQEIANLLTYDFEQMYGEDFYSMASLVRGKARKTNDKTGNISKKRDA